MKKNLKTTFAGVFAGLMLIIGGAIQDRQSNPTAPPVNVRTLLPAIAISVLGFLARDHNQ